MKFGDAPLQEAIGKISAHNIAGADGRKLFGKGHVITDNDVQRMREIGLTIVTVAQLEAGDLGENEAARRVGQALAGENVRMQAPGVGRANLIAQVDGVLRINVAALDRINSVDDGITAATMRTFTPVKAGQLVTLVKIIPFAVAEAHVADLEALTRDSGPIVSVRAMRRMNAALIISGPQSARDRLINEIETPVRARIEGAGSVLDRMVYVSHETLAISTAITTAYRNGAEFIILAGISAIIDTHDVAPEALRAAGGHVTHFGAPVDPGSLLMLGYVGDVPVIGAPGCIKSPKTNIIDWILPRLLGGERLTRQDIIAMGHGGLLDEIEDRPMPRGSE